MSEFPDWPEWRYSPYSEHTEEEREAAQAQVEAIDSADELLSLLRHHSSVLLRYRAADIAAYARPEGPPFISKLLEADPEPIFELLRRETNSWVYSSLIGTVCDAADRLTPERTKRVAAVVRELLARGEPSSRRWLTWQMVLRSDGRAFVQPWLEGVAKDRLLSEPDNKIRYELAEQILSTGYRMPRGLLDFTNQWAQHVGYRTGYVPPWGGKWAPKDRTFFAGESRPLLAPKRPTAPTAPPPAPAASYSMSGAGASHGHAPPPTAGPRHVTIEHTKKSIKAQGVLARVLMGAGFVMPFTQVESRFVVAGVMIVGAILWLQWLKVARWWEHG
ncbi:MAG: hypothetical protein R3E10_09795 [Gemmatimonadota bacterium]